MNDLFEIDQGVLKKYKGKESVVIIPNSVTSIGYHAFYNCKGPTSVTIPNSVTTIRSSAFSGCTGLTSIIVDEGNPSYKSIDGNLYTKDGRTLVQYAIGKKDTSFLIPSSVTAFGWAAFSGCTGLTSVTICDSVTAIGDCAFSGCTGLTSVTIGDSVTTIGSLAFSGCTSLTSVKIPNSVTSIGYFVFSGCTGLTIYCEAESKPSGWNEKWNCSNCPVVWGHKGVNSQRARPTK